MYLINTRQQKSGKIFFLYWPLIAMMLNGCQSLPNYYADENAKTPFDSVITHEFLLAKNQDIVGTIASIQTRENDTLPDIARHFGLGFNDITIANLKLDTWLPKPESQVILPMRYIIPDVKRRGIVLNLANMRLFHFPQQQPNRVITYPIGIGRNGWSTPTGRSKIIAKKKNPVWNVPVSILKEHARKGDPLPRIVPAGPDNPLGDYAMRLSMPSYLIHGTNKPYGVGMQISHGCVRLYPEDIAQLFQHTSIGTRVSIIDRPYLLGWDHEVLYLEAHQPLQRVNNKFKKKLLKKLKRLSRKAGVLIDWERVDVILNQANGIPIPILKNSPDYDAIVNSALSLTHPQRFKLQPVVKPISDQDWSITVATFDDADSAQKLVALLNHQGPQIPSRNIQKNGSSHVVAGPFHSKKQVESIIAKIQREFQFNAIAHPPQSKEDTEPSQWSLNWLFGK